MITLHPNSHLISGADYYEIYTFTGSLFARCISPLKNQNIQFKRVNLALVGTQLEIIFWKEKDISEKEQEKLNRTGARWPRDEIYKFKIKIPELPEYSEQSSCIVCLEQISDLTNKYISPCGHLFHTSCLFGYLDKKNLLNPTHSDCMRINCCQTRKIKPWACPICKTKIYR